MDIACNKNNQNNTLSAYKLVEAITISEPPNTGLGGISDCMLLELVTPAAVFIVGED